MLTNYRHVAISRRFPIHNDCDRRYLRPLENGAEGKRSRIKAPFLLRRLSRGSLVSLSLEETELSSSELSSSSASAAARFARFAGRFCFRDERLLAGEPAFLLLSPILNVVLFLIICSMIQVK